MCWTLKRYVLIAIRVELNFEENKPSRQSNTIWLLLRGNSLNMSGEGKVFPQFFCGEPSDTQNTLEMCRNNERKECVSFQFSHLHPLHLGRLRKSCLLHHLKGKPQRLD